MALREGVNEADPYDVAASWGQLAVWAMAVKNYGQSFVCSEKCFEIRLRYFQAISLTYQNLGHYYKLMGRFDEAEVAIREALAVIERNFDRDCESVAQYVFPPAVAQRSRRGV